MNTDKQGQFKPKALTVTVIEGDQERERFEVDYSPFPCQPQPGKPVRIGANTHGADWTMRNLRVYAEAKPTSGKKEQR